MHNLQALESLKKSLKEQEQENKNIINAKTEEMLKGLKKSLKKKIEEELSLSSEDIAKQILEKMTPQIQELTKSLAEVGDMMKEEYQKSNQEVSKNLKQNELEIAKIKEEVKSQQSKIKLLIALNLFGVIGFFGSMVVVLMK